MMNYVSTKRIRLFSLVNLVSDARYDDRGGIFGHFFF